MQPNLYIPSPVLLPVEIANSSKVQERLMGYMDTFVLRTRITGNIKQGILDSFVDTKDSERVQQDKIAVLQDQVPLFHDAFIVNNKLLLTGANFPKLNKLIGDPLIFLMEKNSSRKIKVKYYQEAPPVFWTRPPFGPNYLVIYDIPAGVIESPHKWELLMQFKGFEQNIALQLNPFANAEVKLTLNTLQKDNPAEWITEWCNYYFYRHGVERVIIYNNCRLNQDSLPSLSVNEKVELWYVEWPHNYKQYFARCQTGALTHSYNWVGKSANYFLNFDIDEYLINDSGKPLLSYMQNTNPQGVLIDGINMPNDAELPDPHKDTSGLKELGLVYDKKYIYARGCWDFLQVHEAIRLSFPGKLRFRMLLAADDKKSKIIFRLYNLVYAVLQRFKFFRKKITGGMERIPYSNELCYLHYREIRNTQWSKYDYFHSEHQ